MIEYNKWNVEPSYSQRNKLKPAVRKKTEVTLRINIKMFDGDELPLNKLEIQRYDQNEPKWGFLTQ